MRKIFANLKSVVALAVVAAMTLSVSCMYDDTALTKRVDKVEKDLAALTEKVNGLAGQEVTLDSLLAGKLVITGVTTNAAGDTVVSLSNGESFTVLAECAGLQYRVVDSVLEISADGETWVAVTANASCLVKEVVTNADGTVTIVFADGTEFTSAVAELIECEATRSQVYVLPEVTKAVRFTINDAVEDINVMNQPLGWSATVEEYVEVEEPDYGGGVMPLAAGGKEYVLNITGPAKDFAQAAKEGVVSVHFNTAAGACKVLNVAVNLAELTLSVDKAGNVHVENTIAVTEEYNGEVYTDFAPIQIGVITKPCYDAFLAGTLDMITAAENGDIVYTSYGFSNKVDLQYYEEGVCEKAIYDLTVADVGNMFYPKYTFVPGNEYVIFLYTESSIDIASGYALPVLETAIVAEYKSVLIDVVIVEDSVSWNDATLNMSFSGFTNYLVGWVSTAYVDESISYGWCTDLDSFFDMYLKNPTGRGGINYSAGAILPQGMPIGTELKLSELSQYSITGEAPGVQPETEYYLFVYPFNMESEMDIYMLSPTHDDVYLFGTFTTTGLVKGDFVVKAAYTPSYDSYMMSVDVAFEEEYTVYYAFYSESAYDVDERVAQVMEDCYYPEAGTRAYVEAYNYGVYPQYLSMVVINAAGEYVYVEELFEGPKPTELTFTDVEVIKNNTNLTFTFSDADNTLTLTFWNQEGNSLADGTYTLGSNFSSYDGVVWNGQLSSSYYCESMTVVVTTTENGQKFDINFVWNGDEFITTFEGVAVADPNAGIPLYYTYLYDYKQYNPASANKDACYTYDITKLIDINNGLGFVFRDDNWNWYTVTFKTNGNTYIAPGTYTLDNGLVTDTYANVYWYNWKNATSAEVEVSFANNTYKFNVNIDYSGTVIKGSFELNLDDYPSLGVTAPVI